MTQICPVKMNMISKQIKTYRTITNMWYFSESAENAAKIESQSPLIQKRPLLEL